MENISDQDWLYSSAVQAVFDTAYRYGLELRLVGGCVRNSLLSMPIKDIDMATPDHPEVVMGAFQDAGYQVIPTGIAHGTVTVVSHGEPVEITTLRRDLNTTGRHAEVEFTSDWEVDAARRDFTMNALYADRYGVVYDYFNGIEDLKNGVLKFIGNPEDRIQEDYLRILRYFRFIAQYGFESKTDQAYACHKHREGLKHLSAERITSEMFKLLDSDCIYVIRDMYNWDILKYVIPNLKTLENFYGLMNHKKLESDALLRLRSMIQGDTSTIQDTVQKMRLSNQQASRLYNTIITNGKSVISASPKDIRANVYRLGKQAYIDRFKLLWASKSSELIYHVLDYVEQWEIPKMPITGQDLLALGFKQGKEIGNKLKELEQKWIASDFTLTKDQLNE